MLISKTKEWKFLELYFEQLDQKRTSDLFVEDSNRVDYLQKKFDQLTIDFSKQKVDKKSLSLLLKLADKANLRSKINHLLNGKKVNTTEDRAALHTALRLTKDDSLTVDDVDINKLVQTELTKVSQIVSRIHSGQWRGYSGKPITDIVNLGVGGSDLGPLLVCDSLDEFKLTKNKANVNVHFASTMDGSQVSTLFESLNPETTIFILVSKSFTTIDTLSNALTAKAWLMTDCSNVSLILSQHFIGISSNSKKMDEWGIVKRNQLSLWDWVGGRFSLWSSVGLSIAIKLGMDSFRELLDGAREIDRHFANESFENNLPVLLGLIGVWNTNFRKINAQAILPYDARLKFFPDYLTQLEMESNGKSTTLNGETTDYDTCPVLWGEVGPNAQHAFYQLLHQGTQKVNCDFIAPIKRFEKNQSSHSESLKEQHLLTLANCFAQSRALMVGSFDVRESLNQSSSLASNLESQTSNLDPRTTNLRSKDHLSSHRFYPGDQPSTTILLKELTPYSLGQLIALYEHKVFVMASIWDINPFDQWGVELGKVMSKGTLAALQGSERVKDFDASTESLIKLVKE